MVDQPKENELDEEKEATASSKEAKKLTAEEKQRAKEREKRRKARAKEAQKKNSQRQKERNKRTGGNKNRRNVWLLIAATILVIGSVFMFTPPNEKINQGLDIQGGLSVVLSAQSTDGEDVTKEDMEKSRAIIESRVNALGASVATVQVQGNDQILVQIPGLSDPETALATIGKTGKLEFARADSFTEADDQAAHQERHLHAAEFGYRRFRQFLQDGQDNVSQRRPRHLYAPHHGRKHSRALR